MKKIFILTNHSMVEEQRVDAICSLGVDIFCELPRDLKEKWGEVPPEVESVTQFVQPFLDWLIKNCTSDDVVWVQGEWGVTVSVLDWCRAHRIQCVYSTSTRIAVERNEPDGSVQMTHIFKHVRFRNYPMG